MRNYLDGGEAILEAFRKLKIDYIMSSPGSEWSPVWEALARQKLENKAGPAFVESWHETLAVNMATGYTLITGRPQAVLLHAGVGMLQGSMGVHGALQNEVPMVVMSGESQSLGENPDIDIEAQWYGGLTVGGIERLVEPVAKWARAVTSPYTLYESVVRAGEMAQRVPKGPVYLNVALEHMLHDWTPPAGAREVPPAPVVQPRARDVEKIAELLGNAKSPVIVAETAGRNPEAFSALVTLADAFAIPVINGRANSYANFPTDHPLYLGMGRYQALDDADVILLVGGRAPWYPPRRRPTRGKIVAVGDNPHKGDMVYQSLHADFYLEGDTAESLKLLMTAMKSMEVDADAVSARRQRWAREHEDYVSGLRAEREKAQNGGNIDPLALLGALGDVMPADTIYVDETDEDAAELLPRRRRAGPRHRHGARDQARLTRAAGGAARG
jgi:acetolactate synthase-1/2/3 large subunit